MSKHKTPEPVAVRGVLAALVVVVAAVTGYQVDDAVVDAVAALVSVAAPLVAAFLARRKVSPVVTADEP
ncbi:MAG: hypothetical protein ACRDYU_00395 [Actinomycetes bacterium]